MELYPSGDSSRAITLSELQELCEPFGDGTIQEMNYLDERDMLAYLVGLLAEQGINRHVFMKACGIELRL